MGESSSFNRGTNSFDVGAEAVLGGVFSTPEGAPASLYDEVSTEGGEYEAPEIINPKIRAEEAEGNSRDGSPDGGGHQRVRYKIKNPPPLQSL